MRPHKAGHRRFKWHDADRNRPVWADVWFPTADQRDEIAIPYGLGSGRVVPDAAVATADGSFPLVVLSPGASGSATNYSWLAEYLARHGSVVLGVSHYGESFVYGVETIDPAAVLRLWVRPSDCTFALTQLLASDEFKGRINVDRINALGHSSGGATALALGGATLDPMALLKYCQSDAARSDLGCVYARQLKSQPPPPPEATRSYHDPRIAAIVALDPAAGPAHDAASLARVRVPVLVVGSRDNDFLPFEHHAARYARLLPRATLVGLDDGEGHFVFLNSCTSDLEANGVPLCVDRLGVDREKVHARLAPQILAFLNSAP